MIIENQNLFTFRDYYTGQPVTFDSRTANRSGGMLYTYKNYLVPKYNRAIPLYAGTIKRGEPFRSIAKSVTVRKKVYAAYLELAYGPIEVEILDSLPVGIRYVPTTGGEVIFLGDDVQTFPTIKNPNCHNYPVTMNESSRCYFRVRAKRSLASGLYAEWLYFFNIEMNWSDVRDSFILNSTERFSLDQKSIIDNQNFIDNYKSKGFYL